MGDCSCNTFLVAFLVESLNTKRGGPSPPPPPDQSDHSRIKRNLKFIVGSILVHELLGPKILPPRAQKTPPPTPHPHPFIPSRSPAILLTPVPTTSHRFCHSARAHLVALSLSSTCPDKGEEGQTAQTVEYPRPYTPSFVLLQLDQKWHPTTPRRKTSAAAVQSSVDRLYTEAVAKRDVSKALLQKRYNPEIAGRRLAADQQRALVEKLSPSAAARPSPPSPAAPRPPPSPRDSALSGRLRSHARPELA